ncbi:MAG: glycosyltransferase family 9 protein [Acidobacteria bacterium]|nr:glycosyltransferase family 9 protein [Acidobacteriota bacterium]
MISITPHETAAGAGLDWARLHNVLLVRLRSIGDTVLMTPCLEAIKTLRNDIAITVISEPLAAPLLEDHPLVDRLLIADESFIARARLIRLLRRSHFDVAINLHGGSTAALIARLSGASHTVGYADYKHSRLLTMRAPAPDVILQRAAIHSVEQQLALLYWAGLETAQTPPPLSLTINPAAAQRVSERLHACGIKRAVNQEAEAANRFAIIAPAAALETKRWSANRFAQVVNHLSNHWKLPCVVIAGREQEAIAHKVASLSLARPQVLTGLSLQELMVLIQLGELFVGNDSGPMHIAAAFNRPVVSIFGASNPEVWRPWTSAPTRVVTAADHYQETLHQPTKRADEAASRIRKIPVSAVTSAIDEVLKEATGVGFKAKAS